MNRNEGVIDRNEGVIDRQTAHSETGSETQI